MVAGDESAKGAAGGHDDDYNPKVRFENDYAMLQGQIHSL